MKLQYVRMVAVVVFALLLAGSLTIDANGRFPGMPETVSSVIAILLFSIGILSSIALCCFAQKGRLWAILLLIGYLVLALPALF